jgi:NADH:ubiquinone oxidoreductase subunit F (NADH-binding)/NADH:ubiquinone oxidoreductase subunit E/NAD-dependent dihydropyrimidine dehydrogenase PreA subunit
MAGPAGAGADPADVDAILASTGRERRHVVAVLSRIQDRYHYLPEQALRRVVETSGITAADIEGVSTFYARFRRKPAGRHTIRVCVGTACYVKGGENIYDAFRLALRIGERSDTDREGLFTVEKAACLGCCMLAPVAQIDDAVYGHLTRQMVPAVLRDFLASRAAAEGDPGPSRPRGAAAGGSGGASCVPAGQVAMCTCTSCRASGAGAVFDAFVREAKERRLDVEVRRSGCSGISYRSPVAEVLDPSGGTFRYAGIAAADVPEILYRHFRAPGPVAGALRSVDRLLGRFIDDPGPVSRLSLELARGPDGAFWGPQVRIVTTESGTDPLDIDGFIAAGGFSALRRCREVLSPEDVIALVRSSGLRGRGGAGYPTAQKWKDTRAAPDMPRFVICNADEGDPGAFMDRLTLESYPFRVIEGMAIAAFAAGADAGIFFIRAEYPLAIRRVREAIRLCRDRGILGSFEVQIAESAGAFVCGEETAMIAAIEGRRGVPRARPPYPSRSGLWGRPTLVNNVETLATVPWIVAHGAEAFRAVGTPRSPGTKTFALAGKILRGGLIEVPMGMPIRRIVEEIGGGMQGGRRLKAVQIGGPSGGCIPEALADLPVDYESLTEAGAMMGSGGMVVLDETDCMVDVACYFMDFTRRESCGTCGPCRVGTRRMHGILAGLCAGTAKAGDIELLEELAVAVEEGSLCGLGRTAPNPVLSTLRYFRGEYEDHLRGRCTARRCKALIAYTIGEKCIGCTRCAQRCPATAIEAHPYERHSIDQARCIRCGNCRQVCPSEAVDVVDRAEVTAGSAAVAMETANA